MKTGDQIVQDLPWKWPGLPLTFTLLGVLVFAAVIWMAVVAAETKGRALDHIISGDDVAQVAPERAL